MSIYTELKRDHDDLREMIKSIRNLPASAQGSKLRLFDKLKGALTDHARAEENIFYTAVMSNGKARDMTLEGHEEHHVIDLLLGEIAMLLPEDETWDAKFEVLRENVEHHLDEEEEKLFKKAHSILSPKEADKLGEEFLIEKKRVAVAILL